MGSDSNDLKVKTWLAAAMRANAGASPEFLVKALTQTVRKDGYEGSEEQCRQDLIDNFAAVRANVGWKYQGASISLDKAGVARLFGRPPLTPLPEEDELPEDLEEAGGTSETPAEETAGPAEETVDYLGVDEVDTEFGAKVYRILTEGREDERVEVERIARVKQAEGQSYAEREHSVTVRLYFGNDGIVSSVDVLEGEPKDGEKVVKAFDLKSLPIEAMEPEEREAGFIDVQIDLTDPKPPAGEA